MTQFHAVMLDETRCEFGVTVEATDRAAARDYLQENYPESSIVQLESPEDTTNREKEMCRRLDREHDYAMEQDYDRRW